MAFFVEDVYFEQGDAVPLYSAEAVPGAQVAPGCKDSHGI